MDAKPAGYLKINSLSENSKIAWKNEKRFFKKIT